MSKRPWHRLPTLLALIKLAGFWRNLRQDNCFTEQLLLLDWQYKLLITI